tara:strand:+ start:411 stop:677 length:267 start_codon:yes stop_codon:yes gene_type:complete
MTIAMAGVNTIFEIASIPEFNGKYAKFVLTNGNEYWGKYGYFGYIANNLIGGVELPVKVKLDEFGEKYFHVHAILYKGLWVKVKSRGY